MPDKNKMSKQITLSKSTIVIPTLAKVPSIREFMARKAGIALPESTDANPVTMKAIRALCVAAGHSEKVVKSWSGELDAERRRHFANHAIYIGALAADPRVRKVMREARNKKTGELVGFNASFRQERSPSVTKDSRIAQLEALVAKLQATPALAVA